jgi:prepilin-type N-terminal cleavage/methylation domain-containing protein
MSIDDVRGTHQTQPSAGRGGFTLVELLAVIMIIALLAALVTPAVMRSLSSARAAAVKTEIDLLHMAVMNYKNEYGSFPPCRDFVDNDGSPPTYSLNTSNGFVAVDRVRKHLQRLFPRMNTGTTTADYQNELLNLNSVQAPNLVTQNGNGINVPRPNLYENNALYFWLAGFSESPTSPFRGNRKPLFAFDLARVYSAGSTSGLYAPSNMKESPYLYREAGAYFIAASGQPAAFLEFNVATSEDKNANGVLDPGEDVIANGHIDPVGEDLNGNMTLDPNEDVNGDGKLNYGEPFNKDSFQIICAGKDGTLGTDDDLSNFWKGTRKDYLDSLK